MYDEWLAEEKATKAAHREALLQAQAQAQVQAQNQAQDAALALGDTAPSARSGSTIRPVTPDTLDPDQHAGRGTSSFDRAYVPVSVVTTTITGGGGAIIKHRLGHGDLIVMGGSCQRTWEHAIPKTAAAVGPRISVQFRPRGVR